MFDQVHGARAEVGFDEDTLHVIEVLPIDSLDQHRDVGQRDRLDLAPQSRPHGKPLRWRQAHSPMKARIASVNSHQVSLA